MSHLNLNASQCKNLWIGDIEGWMDETYLQKCLMGLNIYVKNIKLIRDKSNGKLLGYGFLEFDSNEAASAALDALNGKQMPESNKLFKLNWASYSSNKQITQPLSEYSIYVCELDPSITDEQLKFYFAKIYSSVLSAKIVRDPSTKISKGYGFVKFSNSDESMKALSEMNGKIIKGKAIKTNQASFKKGKYEDGLDKKETFTQDYDAKYNESMSQMYYQQSQDPNLQLYNQSMANLQNYYNTFYMTNGYYPQYNPNQMYYQQYMAAYYPQNQSNTQPPQAQPKQSQDHPQSQPSPNLKESN